MSINPSKSRFRIVWAIFFIFLGLLGLLLPIAPGTLFILYGLYLLNPPWYNKKFKHLKKKFKRSPKD